MLLASQSNVSTPLTYHQIIRRNHNSLGPVQRVLPILPTGRRVIRSVSSLLRSLDLQVFAPNVPPSLPLWTMPTPKVSFTPTNKSDLRTRSAGDILHQGSTSPLH